VTPDIVTMAKGISSGYLPISATAVSARIVAALRESNDEFAHGFTYSGHPTAAAVALKNIEIIDSEGLVERVADDVGPYLSRALAQLASHELVGEARSLGLIGGVEIVRKKGTNERFGGKEGTAGPIVRDLCIRNGLMVRGIRDTIVMCPPFIITHAEIDELVAILARSLDQARQPLRALG
jgi:putrescine aminotransferase